MIKFAKLSLPNDAFMYCNNYLCIKFIYLNFTSYIIPFKKPSKSGLLDWKLIFNSPLLPYIVYRSSNLCGILDFALFCS